MVKKLSNAPVFYTLAQVQFNPILELSTFVPSIQSMMREAHFPDFREEVFQRLLLPYTGSGAGQATAPTLSLQSRYSFGDIAERTKFLLENNGLTFQTTAYESFDSFMRNFSVGLSIVHKFLKLAFVERIGLRYLDAIFPMKDGEGLNDYLVPEVRGLYQKLQGNLHHSANETVTVTPAGQLVTRVIIRNGRIGLPDDFSAHSPVIAPRFAHWDGMHAIVDTDAHLIHREAFELEAVQHRLTALHNVVKHSFKATVTDHAWNAWA